MVTRPFPGPTNRPRNAALLAVEPPVDGVSCRVQSDPAVNDPVEVTLCTDPFWEGPFGEEEAIVLTEGDRADRGEGLNIRRCRRLLRRSYLRC